MKLTLELVQSFDRPAGVESYQWCSCWSPERTAVGLLLDRDTLQAFSLEDRGLRPTVRYPLPPADDREISLHPFAQQIAVATSDGVLLIDPEGSVQPIAEELAGEPRTVLFSRGGDTLWIGSEDRFSAANAICLADNGTLSLVDQLAIDGRSQSFHAPWYHPSREVVAMEVSCGPLGSWLTFVEEAPWGLSRMTRTVNREGDPFYMAGFSPDGDRFLLVDRAKLQLWSWPSCELAEEIAPPGEDHRFCWAATWVGGLIAAATVTEPGGQHAILLCDQRLEPVAQAIWERSPRQHGALFELLGLPHDRLLLLSDQRAGLFQLNSR